MDENRVEGCTCHVIYEDTGPDSLVCIVMDEDGNVVDIYMGDASEDLWQSQETPYSATTVTTQASFTTALIEAAASPGSGELTPTMPISTALTKSTMGSVITIPRTQSVA